jgi:TetR/AcrR family transcriptional regulator, transcriptional repressor for nem operon
MQTDLSPRATEIVACAQSLLASGGYNGFSYADIAESVQISKASIHHHFPSKSELVQVVLRRYREQGRMGLAALESANPDPLKQLQAYMAYWETCIRDGSSPFCVCAMLAAEFPVIPPEVADEVRGHFRDLTTWLASLLKRGVKKGVFRLHTGAESEAMALVAAVHGAMLSARAYGDSEVFASIVQGSVRQLTRPA